MQINTCIRVNDEPFRANSLELVRDLGVWADVSIRSRGLQDEPAGRGVLWETLAVQGLGRDGVRRKLKWERYWIEYQDEKSTSNWMLWLYLFAYRAVVIGIQHLDLHSGFGSEDAIAGSNVKEIIVLLFTVQRLSDRDLPFILNVFDGKLAEWVPSCLVLERNIPLQDNNSGAGEQERARVIKKTQG